MRAYTVTLFVMLIAVWTLSSCSKLKSYKAYRCNCVQEVNGTILFQETYGIHAEDRLVADVDCNDIEERVNDYNKSTESDIRVNCKLQ